MPTVVGTVTKGAVFDSVVDAEDVGAFTDMTEKATPVSADLLVVADSATSHTRKKVQAGNLSSLFSTTSHNHDATYAPIAKGVTNGDSHDHSGGDGAQINHTTLSNIGSNTHSTIDTHLSSTSNPHSVTKAQVGLTSVEDTALSTWAGTSNITTVGTVGTGTWNATAIGIAKGGTGQTTQQAAIDALTNVSAATNEHVLTKDTATGNAIFKAAAGGGGGGYTVYVEEDDSAKANNSAADLYIDFDGNDFDTSVVGNEVNVTVRDAGVDHGSIGGLADDDHPQYIKDSEFTQDSGILVGTGAGTFVEETGATLRTSIGLGTNASVTFNNLSLTGDLNPVGHILPFADITYDLGMLSKRFTNAYLYNIYCNGDTYLTGATAGQMTAVGRFDATKTTTAVGGDRCLGSVHTVTPGASTTGSFEGVAGYTYITATTNWGVGSQIKGLNFGSAGKYGCTAGHSNLSSYGIQTYGIGSVGATTTIGNAYGIEVTGTFCVLWGTISATNVYGVYIPDSHPDSTIGTLYQQYIAKPTRGTANYQFVLAGNDTGSGIWFDSAAVTTPRIWASSATIGKLGYGTTTSLSWGDGTSAKLGFFTTAPVAKVSAYTQTYSTASRTHSNITAVDPGSYATGSYGYNSAAQAQAVYNAVEALIVDIANVKQVLNSVIDDLQAYGLV